MAKLHASVKVRLGVLIILYAMSSLSPPKKLAILISLVSLTSHNKENLSHSCTYSATVLLPWVRLFHCKYNYCLKFEGIYFLLRCFFNFSHVSVLGLSSLLLCFCNPSNHMVASLVSLILASLYYLSGVVSLNSKYLSKLASHSM